MVHLIISQMRSILSIWMILMSSLTVIGQTLEELMAKESKPENIPVTATFKATRIINGHSVERMQKRQLDFRISHRFGEINRGAYEFFGLDYSTIHLSLEYGITDWLMAGIGRSSFEKTMDGFVKFSILRQSSGAKAMPIHLSWLSSTEMYGLKWDPGSDNYFSSRFSFVHQLLIARKFNDSFSLQITPTFIHRNYVPTSLDPNDLYAVGAGARYKLTKRISLNAEYYWVYRLNEKYLDVTYHNPLSVGLDIETGGHVFQIIVTNSQGMREGAFIGKTTGDWLNGGIHLGFNISRVFSL